MSIKQPPVEHKKVIVIEEVVKVVENMKKVEVKVLQGNEWQIERDLVLKKEKVYVPKDEKLRVEIIQLHYDELVAEYGGR